MIVKKWKITITLIDDGDCGDDVKGQAYLDKGDMEDLIDSIDLPAGIVSESVTYESWGIKE